MPDILFYIVKILQFVLGLCVFGLINSNIGFMKALSSTVCTVGLAAVTAFLPVGMLALGSPACSGTSVCTVFAGSGIMSGNFSGDVYFYVRFTPKNHGWVVVAAVAVALKVPYVIPVVFGLLRAPSFAVSMMLGTIVYYMLHTVKLTASAFQSGGVKRTSGWNHGIYKTDTGQQRDVDDGSCSAPGDDGSIWG